MPNPIPKSQKKLDEIGIYIKGVFSGTETKRQNERETGWMEDLRQLKGIYDPDVLARIKTGKSRVYPKYTRSKTVPLKAKLTNMLFSDTDPNFELRPTPEPQLSDEKITEIVENLDAFVEEGNQVTPADIDAAIMNYAQIAVDKMAITIEDQLVEVQYVEKAKNMIKSGVELGTGILKGPMAKSRMKKYTKQNDDGTFSQGEAKEFKPFVGNPSLWRWYPDMSSTELSGCDFVFELHSMTKHELRKLSKKKNFKKDIIDKYIREHKNGDYKLRQWEIDLKTIEENTTASDGVTLDTKKYELLEYNGYLDGQDLMDAGILDEEADVDKDWFMKVWVLGGKVIHIIEHPIESLTELYHVFYFEKDESSIFGEGLPRIVRDTQISICSATRAMLDNAAWVAGPIFEANEDLMPDEDLDDIYPSRVLGREGRGVDAQYPALRVYNIESRISDYLAIIDKFERTGDMESTMPAFLWGDVAKGSNETSKGISIKSSNTNLTINDIVKNFDKPNESFLRGLYQWNIEFNDDKAIKGDMMVKAIGSASLVAREERTNALDFFSQGLQPEDKPYIKRLGLLKAKVKMHDLNSADLLNTQEEADQIMAAEVDAEMRQLQIGKMQSEINYDDAKAANMNSKAEETVAGIPLKEAELMIKSLLTIMKEKDNGKKETTQAATTSNSGNKGKDTA